ncbi:MAG: hypothetical protein Q7S27_01580 [Nanoarchaeota archaeon]|nr:hypothetical protein [Nanoarchaeota archaeon]
MTFKEVIKPNLPKVILSLVIFVILSVLPIAPCYTYPVYLDPVESFGWCQSPIQYFYFSDALGEGRSYLLGSFLTVLVTLAMSYVLAGFIYRKK